MDRDRIRIALEHIRDEAGSHTVALNSKTGYSKIYDLAVEALDAPEPVGCRHIWEITNTTGGKVYKCVKCPAVKSHDYGNIPEPAGTISDGFGSTWGPCPTCQGAMEVVRPGKAQCTKCG